MRKLRVGSLFSGIGGIELGLERTGGFETVFQVEQDEFCRRVLAKHWPGVPQFNDVREVGAHNLPECDLLCGGFPCQDISNAGKRVGIDGDRSGLWGEYARIIHEVRPRYVVVENVAALIRRGLDVVLGDLASSGYDAEWDCVPAVAVGAPHQRDRLFLVAYAACIGDGERLHLPIRRREQGQAPADTTWRGAEMADEVRHAAVPRFSHGPAQPMGKPAADAKPQRSDWWATEPDVGRVANGVPGRVDRLRALGNAVVPQVAEYIGHRILEFHRQQTEAA